MTQNGAYNERAFQFVRHPCHIAVEEPSHRLERRTWGQLDHYGRQRDRLVCRSSGRPQQKQCTCRPVYPTRYQLIMRFDAGLELWGATDPFTLENGRNQIESWFEEVTLTRYDDTLTVDDPKPLAAYILSAPSIPKHRHEEFTHFIEEEMRAQPVIRITKDSGLFTARRGDTTK